MKLSKMKIGNIIKLCNEKNKQDLDLPIYGINKDKTFMPTIADTTNIDKSKYKVMKKNMFVFSGMQTGRDHCIRIGLYDFDFDCLVSPAYTTFYISSDLVLPEYLMIIFKSDEMDRYGSFLSDGSVRANLDWDVFCDIDLFIPEISIQKKYVNIYNSMKENMNLAISGVEELKKLCEIYLEKLRVDYESVSIGDYIEEISKRNSDLKINNVRGVENTHSFIKTRANTNNLNFSNYKIVEKNQFAYNPARINIGSIALLDDNECIISPMYIVFKIIDENLINPKYLMLWFSREEFKRYTKFYSFGSVRDTFEFDVMKEVKIPIPDISVQNEIVNIYDSYNNKVDIYNKYFEIINKICPVLIAGALKEANCE